jgi:solute carrier family 8 (sodium/calcium exchanger)
MSVNHYTYYSNGYVVEYLDNGTSACSSWILVPAENLWPKALRGALYIVALIYFFLGVAIASDIFMASIEVITSKKRKIVVFNQEKKETEEREILIWNETVANLTLMALGSSAPEIILAFGETALKLGEEVNDDSLGTFTIIGSAAFNLLIITSICIVSVPTPEIKKISEFGVFLVTAAWSIWAYVWMLIVVNYSSPGVIEPWEAWVTLAYMPIFVIMSYLVDNGCKCCRKKKVEDEEEAQVNIR